MPWLPSNLQENTEWQGFSGRIGGNAAYLSVRSARAAAHREARVREIVAAIHAWALSEPPDAARIYLSALRRRFQIGACVHKAVDDALANEPWATAERRDNGMLRSWCFVPRTPSAVPLRTIVSGLPTTVDASGPKGRRSAAGRAELAGLSPAQREAAMTVVSLVERDGDTVGLNASDGPAVLGNSKLPHLVAQLSDAAARRKAESRGERWSPDRNTMRPKLISAAANLLHLAQARGLQAHRPGADTLPAAVAPEIRPLVRHLHAKLRRRGASGTNGYHEDLRVRAGLTVLARLLSRRGWHTVAQVDVMSLRADLFDVFSRELISESQMSAARHVWRRIHMLHRHAPLTSKRTPAGCFSSALLTEAIGDRRRRGAVVLPSDSPHIRDGGDTLLDGRYGLRRLLEFLTVSTERLGTGSIPARRLGIKDVMRGRAQQDTRTLLQALNENSDEVRDAAPLADSTCVGYVQQLRRVAQALHRLGEQQVTVAHCISLPAVMRVAEADSWIWTDERSTCIISDLGYETVEGLRACAWAAAQLALHDGEVSLAQQFLTERRALWKWRQRLSAAAVADDQHARKLKRVIDIDRVWRGSDNVVGYVKLGRLRDCIVERIERRTGLTLDEQVRLLATGIVPPWTTTMWAVAARNAAMIHFARLAPLRSRELVRVTRAMLTANAGGARCPIWTPLATVELLVPAAIMKSKRPREGTFAEETDSLEQEERFLRALWALLLMPGGACDVLSAGNAHLFPPASATRRLTGAALSSAFRKEVLRYADALHMDRRALRATYGAAGLHAIRALVGRYLGHDLGLLTQAMVMLHHSSVEFTVKRYVGNTARHTRVVLPN